MNKKTIFFVFFSLSYFLTACGEYMLIPRLSFDVEIVEVSKEQGKATLKLKNFNLSQTDEIEVTQILLGQTELREFVIEKTTDEVTLQVTIPQNTTENTLSIRAQSTDRQANVIKISF